MDKNHTFMKYFKYIWADSGDFISIHYTDTGSTHTDITKYGKRDFQGMLSHGFTSLGRFVTQNIYDSFKQQSIDILLGQKTDCENNFVDIYDQELKKRWQEYTEHQKVTVFVLTWNLNGFEPPEQFDMSNTIFNFTKDNCPDIVMIGFQEIVPQGAKIVATNNEQIVKKWDQLILQNLNKFDNYLYVLHKDQNDILTIFYVKSQKKSMITKVSYDYLKFSVMNQKGTVSIKMNIADSSCCFVNMYLDGGLSTIAK